MYELSHRPELSPDPEPEALEGEVLCSDPACRHGDGIHLIGGGRCDEPGCRCRKLRGRRRAARRGGRA